MKFVPKKQESYYFSWIIPIAFLLGPILVFFYSFASSSIGYQIAVRFQGLGPWVFILCILTTISSSRLVAILHTFIFFAVFQLSYYSSQWILFGYLDEIQSILSWVGAVLIVTVLSAIIYEMDGTTQGRITATLLMLPFISIGLLDAYYHKPFYTIDLIFSLTMSFTLISFRYYYYKQTNLLAPKRKRRSI